MYIYIYIYVCDDVLFSFAEGRSHLPPAHLRLNSAMHLMYHCIYIYIYIISAIYLIKCIYQRYISFIIIHIYIYIYIYIYTYQHDDTRELAKSLGFLTVKVEERGGRKKSQSQGLGTFSNMFASCNCNY